MGASAPNGGHEPIVRLVRLPHVLVLSDIRVPVHAGHDRLGAVVRRVRLPGRVRQHRLRVHGRSGVHMYLHRDRHPERGVPAQTSRHRHGHPATDRGNVHYFFFFTKNLHNFWTIPRQDIRSQQAQLADARQQYSLPARTVSELTLPPPYEQLMVGREAEEGNSDSPPPSYDEAVMNVSSREEATATKSDVFVLDYSVK